MSVGYPTTKADIDSRCGAIALAVRNVMDDVDHFKLMLDAKTDADLTALNYTAGDITTLRSAFVDLARLAAIYRGTQTQATTYDFRIFAKLLTGVA